MRLTRFTDFSLRVLIYAGTRPNEVVTISEVSEAYEIPRNHLVKVVNNLATQGFVVTTRGNGGGVRLARSPSLITLGAVVRRTEPNLHVVECLDESIETDCPLAPSCLLRSALVQAKESFLATLDKITLADCLPSVGSNGRVGLVRLPSS